MNKGERVPIRPVIAALPALLAVLFFGACVPGRFQRPPSTSASPATYDVVIRNGRVMDPESGLDAIRSIGVSAGVISAISTEPLAGRVAIDATGLVVAPGFIDVVWKIPRAYAQLQLLDGVTTTLELWIGTDDVDRWYAEREGKAVTNFGVAVGHERIRRTLMGDPGLPGSPGDAMHRAATDAEIEEIRRNIERGLARGALAVSLTNVTPAASGWETLETFRAAKRAGAVAWAPPRVTGNWDVDDMPRFLTELIGAAAVTGAELNIEYSNRPSQEGHLAFLHAYAWNRFAEAVPLIERAIELDAGNSSIAGVLAFVLLDMDEETRSAQAMADAMRNAPKSLLPNVYAAWYYSTLGDDAAAESSARKVVEVAPRDFWSLSVKVHDPYLCDFVRAREMKLLKGDPRYDAFRRKLGFPSHSEPSSST